MCRTWRGTIWWTSAVRSGQRRRWTRCIRSSPDGGGEWGTDGEGGERVAGERGYGSAVEYAGERAVKPRGELQHGEREQFCVAGQQYRRVYRGTDVPGEWGGDGSDVCAVGGAGGQPWL